MPGNGKKLHVTLAIALFVLFSLVTFRGNPDKVMAQDASPTATSAATREFGIADDEAPIIDIWYGPSQVFGEIGSPQEWVNILGNVSDPDGISSLNFSLNGGLIRPLSFGPDGKRLLKAGDFNVELWRGELQDGENELVIIAIDSLSNQATDTVMIEYHNGNMWPYPYEISWGETENIQDVAQVVDGQWIIEPDGLRTVDTGNDRMVAVGDMVWTDYEVLVPVTIRRVFLENADVKAPSVGVVMRWTGHISPETGEEEQPRSEWPRNTAVAWWIWEKSTKLEFAHNDNVNFGLRVGIPYMLKVRSETLPDDTTQYSVKAWVQSQSEPEDWNVTFQAKPASPRNGSLAFLARHVDVVFGDLKVIGLVPLPTPTPLPTNTPTITPTPTVTNTPTPTITPTSTPTPTATTVVISNSSRAGGNDGLGGSTIQESSSFLGSPLMYGLTFGFLIAILVGLALVRRRLTS